MPHDRPQAQAFRFGVPGLRRSRKISPPSAAPPTIRRARLRSRYGRARRSWIRRSPARRWSCAGTPVLIVVLIGNVIRLESHALSPQEVACPAVPPGPTTQRLAAKRFNVSLGSQVSMPMASTGRGGLGRCGRRARNSCRERRHSAYRSRRAPPADATRFSRLFARLTAPIDASSSLFKAPANADPSSTASVSTGFARTSGSVVMALPPYVNRHDSPTGASHTACKKQVYIKYRFRCNAMNGQFITPTNSQVALPERPGRRRPILRWEAGCGTPRADRPRSGASHPRRQSNSRR